MCLVSIVIPMHNAEAFISESLASILQERDISLEVVVVNDGSTDGSLDRVHAINDQRIRVVNGPCQGVAAALNAGLSVTRGEIIMRSDADDLYSRQRIKRQVDWLARNPEFGAVCGRFALINSRGGLIRYSGGEAEEITEELRNGNTRTHICCFAVRAEVLQVVGGVRTFFRTSEDTDLQLRIGEFCRVWFLPDVEYHYRIHDNSITHTYNALEMEFYSKIVLEFQRQRLTQGSDDLQRGCPPTPPECSTRVIKSAEHICGSLMSYAWELHNAGRKRRAIVVGMHSVMANLNSRIAWRSLLALVIKP